MLRIVIFDDEERIGLQLKELLEQSGDDLVVDFFQDWLFPTNTCKALLLERLLHRHSR